MKYFPVFSHDSGDPSQMCLNEYHLLMLLSGAFIGYSHSLLGLVHNMNYVSFPVIQVQVHTKQSHS